MIQQPYMPSFAQMDKQDVKLGAQIAKDAIQEGLALNGQANIAEELKALEALKKVTKDTAGPSVQRQKVAKAAPSDAESSVALQFTNDVLATALTTAVGIQKAANVKKIIASTTLESLHSSELNLFDLVEGEKEKIKQQRSKLEAQAWLKFNNNIDLAMNALQEKDGVLTIGDISLSSDIWKQLVDQHLRSGFFMAGQLTSKSIEKIRDLLSNEYRDHGDTMLKVAAPNANTDVAFLKKLNMNELFENLPWHFKQGTSTFANKDRKIDFPKLIQKYNSLAFGPVQRKEVFAFFNFAADKVNLNPSLTNLASQLGVQPPPAKFAPLFDMTKLDKIGRIEKAAKRIPACFDAESQESIARINQFTRDYAAWVDNKKGVDATVEDFYLWIDQQLQKMPKHHGKSSEKIREMWLSNQSLHADYILQTLFNVPIECAEALRQANDPVKEETFEREKLTENAHNWLSKIFDGSKGCLGDVINLCMAMVYPTQQQVDAGPSSEQWRLAKKKVNQALQGDEEALAQLWLPPTFVMDSELDDRLAMVLLVALRKKRQEILKETPSPLRVFVQVGNSAEFEGVRQSISSTMKKNHLMTFDIMEDAEAKNYKALRAELSLVISPIQLWVDAADKILKKKEKPTLEEVQAHLDEASHSGITEGASLQPINRQTFNKLKAKVATILIAERTKCLENGDSDRAKKILGEIELLAEQGSAEAQKYLLQ
jgi:hypothetical protein